MPYSNINCYGSDQMLVSNNKYIVDKNAILSIPVQYSEPTCIQQLEKKKEEVKPR